MIYNFDWDKFRRIENQLSEIEEKVILDCFQNLIKGFDYYEEMSSSEINSHFDTFRCGWICRDLFSNKR